METTIRDLYNKILDFEGEGIYEEVLKKWIVETGYNNILIKAINDISEDATWELYAVNRVLDILTLRFQNNNRTDGSNWLGPKLSLEEYIKFVRLLGLNIELPGVYNTFNCEIIEAQNGESDFQINECFFPAVKFKNILIKKAGVRISLSTGNYDLGLINTAKIFWAFRRKNRKYHDLSQGWGNNSQWRTDLRLDIETEDSYIYNQKGRFDLNNITPTLLEELNQQNLKIQEAIELVKYRHFVKSTVDDTDLYPYEFRYEEKKTSPL